VLDFKWWIINTYHLELFCQNKMRFMKINFLTQHLICSYKWEPLLVFMACGHHSRRVWRSGRAAITRKEPAVERQEGPVGLDPS
jgi:hypothetical protein